MENLKRLGGRMNNPDKTLYPFRVRAQKRLQEALELTRYYITVGRRLTVVNTAYATVIRSFTNQWAGLKDRKGQTQPMVPKITAELPIMRW
eukprot:7948053-Ditylum_brightwellii.AAC.1